MALIYVVRHGRAAAGIDAHLDPGLDDLGRQQAELAADQLSAELPEPVRILSSPLARARETARPLAERWDQRIEIEPRVAEIPYPNTDLQERRRWLGEAMAGTWQDLGADLVDWRNALVACLTALPTDTVVFCHFIAINVAVGAAEASDDLVIFAPDNGSITVFDNASGALQLVRLGDTANTHIN